jgi:hypothetical protein
MRVDEQKEGTMQEASSLFLLHDILIIYESFERSIY